MAAVAAMDPQPGNRAAREGMHKPALRWRRAQTMSSGSAAAGCGGTGMARKMAVQVARPVAAGMEPEEREATEEPEVEEGIRGCSARR